MTVQTFWDVQIDGGPFAGLYCNANPLRRPAAEKLAELERANGWTVRIVPTRDALWEETFGDDAKAAKAAKADNACPACGGPSSPVEG